MILLWLEFRIPKRENGEGATISSPETSRGAGGGMRSSPFSPLNSEGQIPDARDCACASGTSDLLEGTNTSHALKTPEPKP